MFATDRDMIIVEPSLLTEVGWSGQKTLSTTGSMSGTTLTIDAGSFIAAGVDAWSVVVVAGVPLEVVQRLSATTATVSLVRAVTSEAVIAPVGIGSGVSVECWTFRPQIALAHRQVLRLLGIDPDVVAEGEVTESMIMNPGTFITLEVLLALHAVYASAGALAPMTSGLSRKAEMFRERADRERREVAARIDSDGDGRAEFLRRPTVVSLIRG